MRRDPPSRSPRFRKCSDTLRAYRERPERATHAPPFTTSARERKRGAARRGASYQRPRHVGAGLRGRGFLPTTLSTLLRGREKERRGFGSTALKGELEREAGAKWVSGMPRVCKILTTLWENFLGLCSIGIEIES